MSIQQLNDRDVQGTDLSSQHGSGPGGNLGKLNEIITASNLLESTVALLESVDTKSLKGTWVTASTVSFGPRPGQPATTRHTLQDGEQRTMTTGTWDKANGVADWGYDEAGSQGNSKYLYFYVVPKSGDDSQMVICVSDNPHTVGPVGYSNYKLVWATYIDSSGNIRETFQSGNIFSFRDQVTATSLPAPIAWSFAGADYAINDVVPLSCGMVNAHVLIVHNATNPTLQIGIIAGPEGGSWLLYAYAKGSEITISNTGGISTLGASSKKIYVRNTDWVGGGSGNASMGWQEITFLGWVDEVIDP